jgi:hypothetical protein
MRSIFSNVSPILIASLDLGTYGDNDFLNASLRVAPPFRHAVADAELHPSQLAGRTANLSIGYAQVGQSA